SSPNGRSPAAMRSGASTERSKCRSACRIFTRRSLRAVPPVQANWIKHAPGPLSASASLGSTPHRKDLRQLVRGDDLELGVCAVGRLLVVAPAPKLRRVAEPRALHVFVGDLDGELGP